MLLYRELGFPLEEVAALLDDPSADPAEHLRRQHRLLRDRLERTQAMVAAVEKEMEARAMGISLTPEERFEVFGEHDPAQYEAEVEERWGDTDAYAESKRKTAAYSKDDWVRIKAEMEDIGTRWVAVMRSGAAPDSAEAMDVAEENRQHISRNFYECSPGDARRPRPDVRRGRAVHRPPTRPWPRPGAVREHRRPGQRRPPGLTQLAGRACADAPVPMAIELSHSRTLRRG